MKANDLMIGDLVTIENKKYWPELKDIPLEVTGISQTTNTNGQHSHGISLKHINQKPNTYYEEYSQFIDYIKPIPLTKEWMLNLGLRMSSGKKPHFSIGDTIIVFKTEFESDLIENYYRFEFGITRSFKCERAVRLDYVNQLQKLCRILTSKELMLVNKNN